MEDTEPIVRKRPADGYVNIMDMAPDADIYFIEYTNDDEVKAFMDELAARKKIAPAHLVEYNEYTHTDIYARKIWAHPELAIHFTCRVSPAYFRRVTKWIAHLQQRSDDMKALEELDIPHLTEKAEDKEKVWCTIL